MTQTSDNLSAGALRWRCRRGMLELDLMLQAFVDKEFAQLSQQEKAVFDRLLDYPDQVMLELFMQQQISSDMEVGQLVKKIRHATQA
jgi:antitoxin CptB